MENLVNAWRRSGVYRQGWKLIIAGPSEADYQKSIYELIRELGVQSSVAIRGEVSDVEKWELYRNCSLFILPSFNENFGIVVAEALASELPVIVSKGTPWAGVAEQNAGWWVDNDVENTF